MRRSIKCIAMAAAITLTMCSVPAAAQDIPVGISLYSAGESAVKSRLNENQKFFYDEVVPGIKEIAQGTRTNTEFVIPVSASADPQTLVADFKDLYKYLLNDMPENLYWSSKNTAEKIQFGYSSRDNNAQITLQIPVAVSYRGGSTYETDTVKIAAAQPALANAGTIAARYAGETPYNKILGYKNEICSLVEYNNAAASGSFNSDENNPWQLIWVFDTDASTNVVCEGYAKAFKYLCDLGGIECYIATGNMSGGTGAGPHMWNVVILDGVSYLVDITNCDGNSVGAPDKLLAKGAATATANGCDFIFDEHNFVNYIYDNDTMQQLPEAVRTVSMNDYVYTAPAKLPAAKTAVTQALASLTVSNDTTEEAVKALVNAAVTDPDVTAVTTVSIQKADTENAGSVTVNVTLKCAGETDVVLDTVVKPIAKLPTQSGDDDNTGGNAGDNTGDNTGGNTGDNTGGNTGDNTGDNKPTVDHAANLDKSAAVVNSGWWVNAKQDWIEQDSIANSYASVRNWIAAVLPEGVEITDVKGEVKNASTGEALYTVTVKSGDMTRNVSFTMFVKAKADTPAPTPVVTYYSVVFTGDYAGSGVAVTGNRTAGSVMSVSVPVGYAVDIISGSNRIASFSDGKGTFVMPAGNVTVRVSSYLGAISTGYKNAYIYSYDKDMNHIKTSSVRGGMTSPEGVVTVRLGSDYAGKSVTLYSGRKSAVNKLDEAVLDSSGRATFDVKSGKNYTLIVED